MNLLFWVLVLFCAAWTAYRGADKLAEPLKQWGLTEAAGAAFIAFATASLDVGIAAASAIRGLKDIGLGNMLGSNIISVPAIVTVVYMALERRPRQRTDRTAGKDSLLESGRSTQNSAVRDQHRGDRPLRVKSEALVVQALPSYFLDKQY